MREKLTDLITVALARCCVLRARGETVDEAAVIADHLFTHGAVLLPCRVGDTVYRVAKQRGVWCVLPREVSFITYRLDHFYRVVWEVFTTTHGVLGKTVFLTQEEAEKALAERS